MADASAWSPRRAEGVHGSMSRGVGGAGGGDAAFLRARKDVPSKCNVRGGSLVLAFEMTNNPPCVTGWSSSRAGGGSASGTREAPAHDGLEARRGRGPYGGRDLRSVYCLCSHLLGGVHGSSHLCVLGCAHCVHCKVPVPLLTQLSRETFPVHTPRISAFP